MFRPTRDDDRIAVRCVPEVCGLVRGWRVRSLPHGVHSHLVGTKPVFMALTPPHKCPLLFRFAIFQIRQLWVRSN